MGRSVLRLAISSYPHGFAQLTYRDLRDIEACLRSLSAKLYHMGFRCPVARSTLADANESATGGSMPISPKS